MTGLELNRIAYIQGKKKPKNTWHGFYKGQRVKVFGIGYLEGYYTLVQSKKGIWQLINDEGYISWDNLNRIERKGKLNNLLMHIEDADGPSVFDRDKPRHPPARVARPRRNESYYFSRERINEYAGIAAILFVIACALIGIVHMVRDYHWNSILVILAIFGVLFFIVGSIGTHDRWQERG